MIIENWTPHTVNCNGRIFPPCGKVVRVDMERISAGAMENGKIVDFSIDGIPCFRTTSGGVSNAPEAKKDTFYIVSAMARVSSGRSDFISPADFIRDASGNITGCRSFDVN